jgi:peptidyl-prolyl cis-trans isomerase C
MPKKLTAQVVFAGSMLVFAWAAAVAEDRVVATVNGKPILEADLVLAGQDGAGSLAGLTPEQRRGALLEVVINNQLLADAAEEAKLRMGARFEAKMRHARRKALRDEYLDQRIVGNITEAEARKLYDQEARSIKPEDEIRVRHILVNSEAEAQDVRAAVLAGADFAKLAEERSLDPGSNWNGGDIGYFARGQMEVKFDAVAFALVKGEVSKVLNTEFGWHVIRLEDRRMRPVPSFEDLRDGILGLMIQRKMQDAIAGLRSRASIVIAEPGLKPADSVSVAVPGLSKTDTSAAQPIVAKRKGTPPIDPVQPQTKQGGGDWAEKLFAQ